MVQFKLSNSAKGVQNSSILNPGATELRINTKRNTFPLINQISFVSSICEGK